MPGTDHRHAQTHRKARVSVFTHAEIPPVSVMEMGIALTLFRGAVLEDVVQSPWHPLTDPYVEVCLTEKGYKLGTIILAIHYDNPDTPNPIMRRVESFVHLLRFAARHPAKTWAQLAKEHNQFLRILHAIAWCPARSGLPFAMEEFVRMAEQAPLSISQQSFAARTN